MHYTQNDSLTVIFRLKHIAQNNSRFCSKFKVFLHSLRLLNTALNECLSEHHMCGVYRYVVSWDIHKLTSINNGPLESRVLRHMLLCSKPHDCIK